MHRGIAIDVTDAFCDCDQSNKQEETKRAVSRFLEAYISLKIVGTITKSKRIVYAHIHHIWTHT